MYKTAGLLFFLAGTIIILGILTAEIFYSAPYSVSKDFISNLGSTPPPGSIIRQPSAEIFDMSMILAGILVIIASYSLFQITSKKIILVAFALAGLGTAGVGIFPAFHSIAHPASALTAFLFSGISAVLIFKITKPPFSYLSVLLGVLTLIFLFLGVVLPKEIVPILGIGGTERWIVYPSIVLFIGLGGYLMGASGTKTGK